MTLHGGEDLWNAKLCLMMDSRNHFLGWNKASVESFNDCNKVWLVRIFKKTSREMSWRNFISAVIEGESFDHRSKRNGNIYPGSGSVSHSLVKTTRHESAWDFSVENKLLLFSTESFSFFMKRVFHTRKSKTRDLQIKDNKLLCIE